MFSRQNITYFGRECIAVTVSENYSLKDTFECGQCFRYEKIYESQDFIEYIIPVKDILIDVGQRAPGELLFFGIGEELLESQISEFFGYTSKNFLTTESFLGIIMVYRRCCYDYQT